MLKRSPVAFGIISEEAASEVLEPYHQGLFQVVTWAFQRFIGEPVDGRPSEDAPINLTPTPSINYKTSTMHDLMTHKAREVFGNSDDVEIVEGKNFLLKVANRLFLRFKKLNEELATSNYPTARSVAFDSQLTVPGLLPLPRITIGYQPKETWDELVAVAVVFAKRKHIIWNYELSGKVASVESFSPLADTVLVKPKANLDLFKKNKSEK